jgi:hypothetical protein
MDQESIVLEIDPRSVLAAIKQANTAVEGWEKGTVGAGERMQKSLERMSEMLIKVNDRSRSSMERLTQSIEKQAAAYGKTEVERLIADRDRYIKKLGDEQGMVDRVTAAYNKMIEAAGKSGGSEIKQLGAEARESKASLALMGEEIGVHIPRHIRGFISSMPGVGTALSAAFSGIAVVALIGVIVEAIKKVVEFRENLKKLREAPERIEAEFARLTGATKAANDEMRVANDRLENAITKLEHRPQNNLKLAIDEAAVAADHLSEKMDKALRSFADVAIKNAPGVFANIIGGQAGIDDVVKLVQGKSGYGGLIGDLYKATSSGGDPTKVLGQYRASVGTMIRQSEMAEAYQQGKGFEGVSYEEIRGAMTGRGKLPPGLHFENMLAEQGPRLETLRALDREIDLLGQSYGLEKKNTSLTGQEDRLKDVAKATGVTEELRQQVSRAQEGELNGLARINAAHEERLRHLKEEGELNTVNAKLAGQIRDAEIARFGKEEQRKTATAVFGANTSLGEAGIRSNYAIFQANRKASGAAFGEADINAEYDTAMALAQKQFDLAAQHVRELRDMNATDGEIQRAQIEATKNFAVAALDAETKKRVELIDLARQQRDEESKTARANYDNARRLGDAMSTEQERRERDVMQRQIKMTEALGLKTSGGQVATALTVEQLRIAAAQAQHNQAIARISQETIEARKLPGGTPDEQRQREAELNRLKIEGVKTEGELQRQIDDAHQDRVVKLLELQKREMDEIQNKASGLFHTLFTKPQDFGKQLGSTVKEAMLKPITEGLGGLVASAIHPLIYGSDGQGGIAGIFRGIFGGGKQDPIKAATDLNTAVTAQNSVAIASLTAVFAAAMGMGAPAIAAPSGIPGGISLPAISISAPAGSVSGSTAGTVGTGAPISIPVAPGGAGAASVGGSPTDILNLPAMHSGASMNPVAMILGANQRGGTSGIYSMFTKDGISKTLSNLKGTVWNQQAWDASDSNFWGAAQGVAKSPAAGAAGMMLAMNGLFGGSRGTWGGIAQSTAGGALIGEQIGGPLGAAIGAGAGFLASLGEKLFGVESPENEAKRLVKQIYSINIDTSMARKIVSIAQQKYANHVSIAVRDPDVRKMLQLYAEGTGQKFPLSATNPVGGSLVEQGGKLYQQASYVNGVPYSFQSSLPVLGGLGAANTYPNPGGPVTSGGGGVNLALNINGQPITPEFVTDQAMAAQGSSYYRTQQSANMQVPGLMVA